MKRWMVVLAVLLVAISAFAQVSGRVVVAGRTNGEVIGVPGAVVQFYAPNASPILRVPTVVADRTGGFAIRDLRPGVYTVIARARGYEQVSRVTVQMRDPATPVRVVVPMRLIRNTGIRGLGVE
ncbi:MAG: carboxypeptidase-like regulatory domain-containing protein [bacterium]|nr:carboxypeptidase-like regulatory domain-containing protein [bacterium]